MRKQSPLKLLQSKIIKAQAIIFLVFLFFTAISFYEAKPLSALPLLDRSPASEFQSRSIASTTILKINCSDSHHLRANAYQLRIEGEFCEKSFDAITVKNTSTGFEATVFKKSNTLFTTDFIELKEGKNLLQFSYKTGSAITTRDYEVLRN